MEIRFKILGPPHDERKEIPTKWSSPEALCETETDKAFRDLVGY